MFVCVCNAVTDGDIKAAVADGCTTLRDLRLQLGVAGNCGRCSDCARGILRESLQVHAIRPSGRSTALPAQWAPA